MPVLFGLLTAFLIGTSDFLGARSSVKTTALQTTTAAFIGGAIAVTIYAPFLGTPSGRDLWLGALSGIAAAVALTTIWQGYARSTIGIVAPIAAVVSAVLPVLWETSRGDGPRWIGWLGVVVGVSALMLTSWARDGEDSERVRIGVMLGVGAGVAFAAMFLIAVATSEKSGVWPVAVQRYTAFALAVMVGLAAGRRPFADVASVRWSVLAGITGASGVASTVYAGQRWPFAPIVVAGSLYPIVAVALAWIFLQQRLTRRQMGGLVAAIIGVALIAID